MRWVGHVERMGEKRKAYGCWWSNLKKWHHSEDLGINGRIILKYNLMKQSGL
jgi:hypothetical protein